MKNNVLAYYFITNLKNYSQYLSLLKFTNTKKMKFYLFLYFINHGKRMLRLKS
jgi:hypothetical protein